MDILLRVAYGFQGVSEEYWKYRSVAESLSGAGKWLLGVSMGMFTALVWRRAAP